MAAISATSCSVSGRTPSKNPSIVIRPSGAFMLATIVARAFSGFGAIPPCRPECRSPGRAARIELESGQTLRADDQRRSVLAPHRAVGADRHVGAQAVAVRLDQGAQARRADLLLTLEEEDQADRRPPYELRERLGDGDRDEQIPLVVAR